MEFVTKLPPLRNFTIPRKISGPIESPPRSAVPKLSPVSIESEAFQRSFSSIFMGHISTNCSVKEQIKIRDCVGITNAYLEQKFNAFRKYLEELGFPSDVSYGFMVVNVTQQVESILERGLKVGNFTLGEVGDAEKGVYLVENPDLVVPSVFFEPTTLRILCFKILKGKSRTVDLGSHKMEPSFGYHSHVPPAVKNRKLSRYILHRFSQVYLFESFSSGKLSKFPANVLPFAIYTAEFFPTASAKFNCKMINVWSGSLKSGPRVYHDISLCSVGGVLLKPLSLLSELQIPALVDWTSCLQFPFIQELLSPSLIGDLSVKKELYLSNAKQFISYYILSAADINGDFVKFVELAQVHRVVGYQILDSDAHILLIPNGSLSMALCLPYRTDPVFHCLHLSKESCIGGMYKPLDERESAALNRDPLFSEKIDGLNKQVEKIVVKSDCDSKNGHLDRDVTSEVLQSTNCVCKIRIMKSVDVIEKVSNSVDVDRYDDKAPSPEIKKLEEANEQQPLEPKNTIRKTKVITSSSLMDPRLTVSEYFKKRKAEGRSKRIPDLGDIAVKRTRDVPTVQTEALQQVTKQEKQELVSPSCSSHAYQARFQASLLAPLPQVALVIERMRDSKSEDSSIPTEKKKHVGQSFQKTHIADEVSESYEPKKSCEGNLSLDMHTNAQSCGQFGTSTLVDLRSCLNPTILRETTPYPLNQRTYEISCEDKCSRTKENHNAGRSDVDLRIMCMTETRLAKIMSDLRSRCQYVKDSEAHHFLSQLGHGSVSADVNAKTVAVNAFQCLALHGRKHSTMESSLEREVTENYQTSGQSGVTDNFGSSISFNTCIKRPAESDDERDMDYRLNSTAATLLKSAEGDYISCSTSTPFSSAMLPV